MNERKREREREREKIGKRKRERESARKLRFTLSTLFTTKHEEPMKACERA